jgi:5-histidylcysteine sulfoxide synthase
MHPAAFYVNKLRLAGLWTDPIDAAFERRFAVGVDEMAWDDPVAADPQADPWPSLSAVVAYRDQVPRAVRRLLDDHPAFDAPPPGAPVERRGARWAFCMCLEHERIHLETSSVLMRELPLAHVRPPRGWPRPHPRSAADITDVPPGPPDLVPIGEGTVHIGRDANVPAFGWDNEFGARTVRVPAFRVGRTLVSNGAFREFVRGGGYREPRWWSEDGWRWRAFRNAKWPTFWVPAGPDGAAAYRLRLCFEEIAMPWSWPAIVNFHEAKAYCAWRTEKDGVPYRLLTEAEHHRLREVGASSGQVHNVGLRFGSESPVDDPRGGQSVRDVRGNVWQWCEDHFAALPGFRIDPLCEDFSTPCFDGQHQLIMGGSFASTGTMTSPWARFHFRPHFFQHAGFRVVQASTDRAAMPLSCRDAPPPHASGRPCCVSSTNKYEDEAVLHQYLLLHYAAPSDVSPFFAATDPAHGFPARCAALLVGAAQAHGRLDRALDLGCAVGGATFALARAFDAVVGIDKSERFIAAARALQRIGEHAIARRG